MFKPVNPKQSFPKMEERLLKEWKKNKTFEKSVKNPAGLKGKDVKEYIFYDGPPFATGLPHYGHLLAGTIKDVIPRYYTMQGYQIERKWGWDCHGLPVENIVEKELNLGSKTDIEAFGIGNFNEACRSVVLRYTKEWRKTVERMGRWVDMDDDYKTMNPEFMESIWWVFKQLWEKDLIYEGNKVVPYCPRCATPLSNFETNQGYQDKQDPAVTVKFELVDEPGTYLLAWTTTPWTLPSNLAVAVGPKLTYAKVKDKNGEKYIMALDRVPHYYKNPEDYTIEDEFLGKTLDGKKYKPLLPYFADKKEKRVFTVTTGNFVTLSDGTGLVHMAPFGEDDLATLNKLKVEIVHPLDAEGRFNETVKEFEGELIFDANPKITKKIKEEGNLIRHETINHSYPFCWRCDTPLIYRPISTWFVKVESLKKRLLKNNQKIAWMPDHIQDGRFGKWLEGARDWAISRNRYWGTPLPIWRNEEEEIVVVGSIKELEKLTGKKIKDLHKHKIDDLTIKSKKGDVLRRVPEVLDCWFESGSMPYAQLHYPFENKKKFEGNFPAEFIAEGLDQTRGWFYTLHVLATALFDEPAFKNCIVNGIVLAEDGQKMSKRLKNYPDPNKVLEEYGADALRFYLCNSPVVKADDMRFSEKGVNDVVRNVILPIWNAYSFFVTYAKIDGWKPEKSSNNHGGTRHGVFLHDWKPANKLDQWILLQLNDLIREVSDQLNHYDLQKSSQRIYQFVDDLTNWYIRRSRRRFWKAEDDGDKNEAYQTLYTVLIQLCQVIAPFMPFVSDEIYRNLTGEESVHLTAYPKAAKAGGIRDSRLQGEMELTKTIVSLGLGIRARAKIKVRQPLSKAQIAISTSNAGPKTTSDLPKDHMETVMEELNVKDIEFIQNPDDLATVIAKPNAKLLGPKYGKEVQTIIQKAKAGEFENLKNGNILVAKKYELSPEEMEIAYVGKEGLDVQSQGSVLVALDTKVTPELEMEGFARDLIRQIQELRKAANYKVDDRIQIALVGASKNLLESFGKEIMKETLTTSIETDLKKPDQKVKFEGVMIKVKK